MADASAVEAAAAEDDGDDDTSPPQQTPRSRTEICGVV